MSALYVAGYLDGRHAERELRAKCCGLCGRWGVRGFRESYSSDGVNTAHSKWVCANDRACNRRAANPVR